MEAALSVFPPCSLHKNAREKKREREEKVWTGDGSGGKKEEEDACGPIGCLPESQLLCPAKISAADSNWKWQNPHHKKKAHMCGVSAQSITNNR